MKFFIVACLVAVTCADVSHVVGNKDEQALILRQELDLDPEGSFQWGFETENGIQASANGQIVRGAAPEEAIQKVQGEASWVSPEGENVVLRYVADENGYQPQGSHLPTPPPIPEAILRSLEYIRTHAPAADN